MTTTLAYNRALHPDDYLDPALRNYAAQVWDFERFLRTRNAPFRKDHEHRTWEYANVLRQLTELIPNPTTVPVCVLDTGGGGSALAPLLAWRGYDVLVTDSMVYGDIIEPFLIPQSHALGIQLPVRSDPVERLSSVETGVMDVALCISVIEHVDAAAYGTALTELVRVTKPGGHIFITSDYFRDDVQADLSPYRSIQHTCFTAARVREIAEAIPVTFVGGVDLDYRGNFVHNYSFVNLCFRTED